MNNINSTKSHNSNQSPNSQIIKTLKNQNQPKNTQPHIDEIATTISNLSFLHKNTLEPIPENLNKIPQETRTTSTIESNKSQNNKNIKPTKKNSFAFKTKEWAKNMWNSIKSFKLKKIFAKAEYKEFRNANGDLVKIPVKKIPLKKKKEENVTGKKMKISHEQNKIVSNFDGIATGMYLVA